MKRRTFGRLSAGAAAGISGFSGFSGISGCGNARTSGNGQLTAFDSGGTLAGVTPETVREQYRYDLFDDFLPFMDSFVIDHEYGGFMCNTGRDGKNLSTAKSAWYEGRGIWVYSFLYNKVEPDPKFKEVADKSAAFIMKHKPDSGAFWQGSYSREGTLSSTAGGEGDIYGNLFIANGLAEYSQIPGNGHYWDTAKDILLACMKRYDSPDYSYDVYYGPAYVSQIRGPRVLGHWMVLIRLVTQMLESRPDPELESLSDRCVDAVMNYHLNPEYDLLNEALNHDLSRPEGPFSQFVYTGHAIETLWMLLYEAARRKDRALFDRVSGLFRRHVEVAWDDVYGGVFRCLDHVDDNTWKVDKVLWAQEEVLIGSLFVAEHTGELWAKEMFAKMFDYVQDKYPLKQYGYPLWILGADRKVTFAEEYGRVGNFHHPRHLMLNLLSLDRMIGRSGNVSDIFS